MTVGVPPRPISDGPHFILFFPVEKGIPRKSIENSSIKDTSEELSSELKQVNQNKTNTKDSIKKAEEIFKKLSPLHKALFIESNPSPVKYAASLLGMCNPSVRLPLVEVREETKKKITNALKVAKLL